MSASFHHRSLAITLLWLGRRMTAAAVVARRRLWGRMAVATVLLALAAGTCAFVTASLAAGRMVDPVSNGVLAAFLAAMVATATAAALYPVLRQREHWLLLAASALSRNNIEILSVVGKLAELRGGDTAGHTLRVALYTVLFGESLALTPEEMVRAAKGALLHDIGKLVVPDHILGKPGPLTSDERTEMAAHVVRGMEVVAQSQFLSESATIVAAHHERYDGDGYPHGLKGEAIPREARMFALVDVFDALISPRVYKAALTVSEALIVMAGERGSHFDPALFDRFRDLAPRFARQLPQDQDAQATMLMARLRPYLDRFLLGQPVLAVGSGPTGKGTSA
ncbi:MAG: HD-GYP domain-containing protein [Magnetospirillum sp.]